MSVTGSKNTLDVSLIDWTMKHIAQIMTMQVMIPYTYFISAFPSFSFSTTVIIRNKKSLDCLCI